MSVSTPRTNSESQDVIRCSVADPICRCSPCSNRPIPFVHPLTRCLTSPFDNIEYRFRLLSQDIPPEHDGYLDSGDWAFGVIVAEYVEGMGEIFELYGLR
jgi:hypothetical protein